MKRTWLLFICSLLHAANRYVSPSATSGTGTIGDPWNVITLLGGPVGLAAGDTVFFRQGTYVIGRYGPSDTNWRDTSIGGTNVSRVALRPFPGETVFIDGAIHFNSTGYIDIIGFNWFCSFGTRISTISGPNPTDMRCPDLAAFAPGVRFINNHIVALSNGIALWESAPNSMAYGNIIIYPGHSGPDRGHGHGLYVQNNTGQHVIKHNIIGQTFGQGGQVFGTALSSLRNVLLKENIFYLGGSMVNNFSRNLLVGGNTGAVAEDMEIDGNISYGPTTLAGGTNAPEMNLGYWGGPGGGCTNMIFRNNLLVGEVAPALSISDGTASGTICNFNVASGSNTIYGSTRGLAPPGTNTLINAGTRPSIAQVFVYPNEFETGRANIYVMNWARENTVSVDISSVGLTIGTHFVVKDAQDFLGPSVYSGVYNGSSINLPMTNTGVTAPGATVPFNPVHTDREINFFVLMESTPTGGRQSRVLMRGKI